MDEEIEVCRKARICVTVQIVVIFVQRSWSNGVTLEYRAMLSNNLALIPKCDVCSGKTGCAKKQLEASLVSTVSYVHTARASTAVFIMPLVRPLMPSLPSWLSVSSSSFMFAVNGRRCVKIHVLKSSLMSCKRETVGHCARAV